ncbi:MAG: putative dsRNA-binding protein [Deinococcales bacterium]
MLWRLTKRLNLTPSAGPEHELTFITDVLLDGEVYGTGQGTSKREAEKNASSEVIAAQANPPKPYPTQSKNYLHAPTRI